MTDYDAFDDHGDPKQYGVDGWNHISDGTQKMSGVAIGIVLSVQLSDSDDNLTYQMAQSDLTNPTKASNVEARVLMINMGVQCFVELAHCVVLPWGKTSNTGPGQEEPADFSQDIPNGCTPEELDAYYANGSAVGIENLSGDYVILGFVGGLLQSPVILDWFPHPKNKADPASVEQGRQFVLRRNNSELLIDKNGDWHFTHRTGQYLQLKGKNITLKHREGQTLHMDEDGTITILTGNGNQLQLDEDGLTFGVDGTMMQIAEKGMRLMTPQGEMNVISDRVNLIGDRITATGGGQSKALLHEDLLPEIQQIVSNLSTVNNSLASVIDALATPFPVLAPLVATLKTNTAAIAALDARLAADAVTAAYRTKVLSGE